MNIKEQIHHIVDQQPEDSSYEEILKELAFDRMIKRGLADTDQGRIISDENLSKDIETW